MQSMYEVGVLVSLQKLQEFSWTKDFVQEGFRCTVNLKHVDYLMLSSDIVNFQGTISEKVDRLIRWKCNVNFE